MPQSLIDGTDPAQMQVAPRMELARALIQSGADTSPAYPMQAIARAIQPIAGHYIQQGATSELARLYAQQAGGLAGAFKGVPGSDPLVAALNNPATAPFALQHAGKALMELPEKAAERAWREKQADRPYNEMTAHDKAMLEQSKVPPGWVKTPDGGLAPMPGGPADPAYIETTTRPGRMPVGWESTPQGGMKFRPGGPADPKYLAESAEAKVKPREFSVSDVTKLSEEGGKFGIIGELKNTFEPRFAGYKGEAIGNAATWMGRNLPSMASKDTVDAAQWWQGYDRFKNVVRNELFGAALTATEKAAFERADINAGMDPKTIEANLARQHEIAQNGLKRKANGLIQSGYDPKAISATYGLKLEDIGVTAGPKGKSQDRVPSATAPAAAPPAAPSAAPAGDPLAGARDAIAKGANRDAVIKRLRDNGLDPSGL